MRSINYTKIVIIPFLYITIVILLPLIFCFLLIPLIIYRRFVARIGKLFGGPLIGKILDPVATSHICAPGKGTCIVSFTVQGIPDLDKIKLQFTEIILNARDKEGLIYSELRQTVVSWGGYYFWEDAPKFKLPIYILDTDPVDIDSVEGMDLIRELYGKEWKLGKEALWEILIIPGLNGNFGILFRFHHALCDGVGIQNLIDKVSQPSITPKASHVGFHASTFSWIRTLFRIHYDLALHFMAARRTKYSNQAKENGEASSLVVKGTSLHLPELKKITQSLGGSLHSLIMSSIHGSLSKQRNSGGKGTNIMIYFPTPAPSHSGKLRNVTGTGYIEHLQKDGMGRIDTLREIDKQLLEIKNTSTFPLFTTCMARIVGSFPTCLLRRTIKGASSEHLWTNTVSSFVMSRGKFDLFGYQTIRIGSAGSTLEGTKVVGFNVFSSADVMRLTLMGDQNVITNDEAEALLESVVQEIYAFKETISNTLSTNENTGIIIEL